jgi:hypothetical protein
VHRAAHPLWADCHNISLLSLREGWIWHRASDVNLLTADAIPEADAAPAVRPMIVVVFSRQVDQLPVCHPTPEVVRIAA